MRGKIGMMFLPMLSLTIVCCAQIAEPGDVATGTAPMSPWAAQALVSDFDHIAAEGLIPADYDLSAVKTDLEDRKFDAAGEAAAALFRQAAEDVSTGIIPPEKRTRWRIPGPEIDEDAIDAAGERAMSSLDFASAFSRLAPDHAQYRALKAALDKTPPADAEKAARIKLNMERWRWMPRDLGPSYILVNAPAYELTVVRNGEVVDRRKVIVGTKVLPTPQFAATVTGVAFNPTWFVPASIVAESVGALIKNDPDAAKAKGYYLGEDGNVRQKPGPNNALGQMKLLMPNPYSVFLHDTPAKAAFKKDARALSHGCIRVEDAVGFARGLVKGVLDDEALDKILASKVPTEVALEKPMPVYVVYFTAVAAADGTATFYPDIYGLDAELLPAFGADAPPPSDDIETVVDVCPAAAPAAR